MKRYRAYLAAVSLVISACGGDGGVELTTSSPHPQTSVEPTTTVTAATTTTTQPATTTTATTQPTTTTTSLANTIVNTIALPPDRTVGAVSDTGGGFVLGFLKPDTMWVYDTVTGNLGSVTFELEGTLLFGIGPVFYVPPSVQGFYQTDDGKSVSNNVPGTGRQTTNSLMRGDPPVDPDGDEVPGGPCEGLGHDQAGTECRLAQAGGSIWVTQHGDLIRISLTGEELAVIEDAAGLIVGGGNTLWVADRERLMFIDTDRIAAEITLPVQPNRMVEGAGWLWIQAPMNTNPDAAEFVTRYDPVTLEVTGQFEVRSHQEIIDIAAGEGSFWLAGPDGIERYDAETLELITVIEVAGAQSMVAGEGALWVFANDAEGGFVLLEILA